MQIYEKYDIFTERRTGRRKTISDEKSSDYRLCLIQETSRGQLEALDKLATERKKHTMQINTLKELFSFQQVQILLDTEKDDTIARQILYLYVKYFNLNTATKMTEVYHTRRHAVLFKEVHSEVSISTCTTGQL